MLKIARSNGNDAGRWFSYAPGVEFCVRRLTASVSAKLRAECTTIRMEPDPATRKLAPVENVDMEKLNGLLCEYILVDWKGIVDESDEQFPVSAENKRRIIDELPLREFIWAAAQSLDITAEQQKN